MSELVLEVIATNTKKEDPSVLTGYYSRFPDGTAKAAWFGKNFTGKRTHLAKGTKIAAKLGEWNGKFFINDFAVITATGSPTDSTPAQSAAPTAPAAAPAAPSAPPQNGKIENNDDALVTKIAVVATALMLGKAPNEAELIQYRAIAAQVLGKL